MPATRLSFSYPQKMKEKLSVLAEKDCRSLSSYIQMILANHIEEVQPGSFDIEQEKPKKKVSRRKRA